MKKHFLLIGIAAVLTASLFVSCSEEEDTLPPTITLNGANPFPLSLNATYNDPGATAIDDEDGDISSRLTINSNDVNKDKVGSYEVHYEVSDNAGNAADVHRTVNVTNSLTSSVWIGSYSCLITTTCNPDYNYNDGSVISTTLNNGLEWNKFGDYSNATAKLNFTVDGSGMVSVPSQTFTCGSPAVLRQFSGSGTTSGSGAVGSTMTLIVSETVNSVTCSYTYTFTKL